MAGRIPWTRYSGEDVEMVLAAFVSREVGNSIRIRPAKGDGGIDLIAWLSDGVVDVYQVKKFAENLGNSQKSQIKGSWERLQKTLANEQLTLRTWHLVMPLDPTPGNLAWARGMVEPSGAKFVWDGLARVDGWAAAYPEIVDYYLVGGKKEIEEGIERVLSLSGLDDLSDPAKLQEKIFSLCRYLDTADPFYSYSLKVLPACDKSDDLAIETPGLVMREVLSSSNGDRIVVDMVQRAPLSTFFSPVSVSGAVGAVTKEDKTQLRNFIDFGTTFDALPFRLDSGSHRNPIDLGRNEPQRGFLSSFPVLADGRSGVSLALSWKGIREMPLILGDCTSGRLGRRMVATDTTGTFTFHVELNEQAGTACVNYSLLPEELTGESARDVARTYSFLRASLGRELDLLVDGTRCLRFELDFTDETLRHIAEIADLAGWIEVINHHSDEEAPFPVLDVLTMAEANKIKDVAMLLADGVRVCSWNDCTFTSSGGRLAVPVFPAAVWWIEPLDVSIAGHDYRCGLVRVALVAGSAENSTVDESAVKNRLAFRAADEYGNKAMRQLIPASEEALRSKGQLWFGSPLPPEEWAETISALESQDI